MKATRLAKLPLATALACAVLIGDAQAGDIITDDVSMPAALVPVPVVDVMHELIPVRRGESAAKQLEAIVHSIASSPKHDGKRLSVRRELFDGDALASKIYGDAGAYDEACKDEPKACASLEAALVELYAEALGHQLHIAAVTTASELFVVAEESKSSTRVKIELTPAEVHSNAWFPAKADATGIPVAIDFVVDPKLPGQIVDLHVFDRSLSSSLGKHAGKLAKTEVTPADPLVEGEAVFTTTWFAQPATLEAVDAAWNALAKK